VRGQHNDRQQKAVVGVFHRLLLQNAHTYTAVWAMPISHIHQVMVCPLLPTMRQTLRFQGSS
jgi:hypothetical protein